MWLPWSWIPWNLSFPYILFHEKILQTMQWHHNARVNSHQRWKHTRLNVCFHFCCELTSIMNVTEWQVSWNSFVSWLSNVTCEIDQSDCQSHRGKPNAGQSQTVPTDGSTKIWWNALANHVRWPRWRLRDCRWYKNGTHHSACHC